MRRIFVVFGLSFVIPILAISQITHRVAIHAGKLIDGKSEFACVDGPEFDGHKVNFEVLVQRNAMYRTAEQQSMEEFKRLQKADAEEGVVCGAASGPRQGGQR